MLLPAELLMNICSLVRASEYNMVCFHLNLKVKYTFFKKLFQEHYQSVKGSVNSDLTNVVSVLLWVQSKNISGQQNSPPADKELREQVKLSY